MHVASKHICTIFYVFVFAPLHVFYVALDERANFINRWGLLTISEVNFVEFQSIFISF